MALPPIVVEVGRDTGIGELVRVLQVEPLEDPVPKPERKRKPVTAPREVPA